MLYNHFLAAPCSQEREMCSQGRAGSLPELQLSLWICTSYFQNCFLLDLYKVIESLESMFIFSALLKLCFKQKPPKVGPGSDLQFLPLCSVAAVWISPASHPGEAVRKIKGTGDVNIFKYQNMLYKGGN